MPDYLDIPLLSAASKPSRYPKGEINPVLDGNDRSNDSWLNAGCIGIPDGPVIKENKFFDKICFGCDRDNLYLRFYISEYMQSNPELLKNTYQMYVYTRSSNRRHSLSPMRLINKTENILPVSKEKFHSELQITVSDGRLRLIRLIKAIPNNLWAVQNSKEILAVYDRVMDLRVPFRCLDIETGESVEFIFVIASGGVSDLFIPNEMLLNMKRE